MLPELIDKHPDEFKESHNGGYGTGSTSSFKEDARPRRRFLSM
jgi:hypothetical protein